MLRLSTHRLSRLTVGKRVEILGAFGSGKTTLAKALSRNRYLKLLERHELNMLWTNNAANAITGYLAYDLWFLLHHVQLAAMHSGDVSTKVAICDWSFLSDQLWARMRLKDDLPRYEGVHKAMIERVGPPLGYLYLKQEPAVVVDRLRRRARPGEKAFETHARRATRLLDEVAESIPPRMVMRISRHTDLAQVNDQVIQWLREPLGVR